MGDRNLATEMKKKLEKAPKLVETHSLGPGDTFTYPHHHSTTPKKDYMTCITKFRKNGNIRSVLLLPTVIAQ